MTISFRQNFVFDLLAEGHSLYCIQFNHGYMQKTRSKEIYDWLQQERFTAIITDVWKHKPPEVSFDYFDQGGQLYFVGDAEMMELKLTWVDNILSISHAKIEYENKSITNIEWIEIYSS